MRPARRMRFVRRLPDVAVALSAGGARVVSGACACQETGRGLAVRPQVDLHYLSEFILVVFLLERCLKVRACSPAGVPIARKFETAIGENGSCIGRKLGVIVLIFGAWN